MNSVFKKLYAASVTVETWGIQRFNHVNHTRKYGRYWKSSWGFDRLRRLAGATKIAVGLAICLALVLLSNGRVMEGNEKTKRIYLLRHGKIDGFGKKSYIGGRTDIPLNADGRAQALAWNRYFDGRLPERVFSSDLQRSAETARIIAGTNSSKIRYARAFREIDLGRWEGRSMEEIRGLFPEQWKTRGADLEGFRPPDGESFGDLARRVIPVFQRLADESDDDFMLVAHAGVNRVILARELGVGLNEIFKIPQDYAALNIIEISSERRKAVVLNETVAGIPF